MRKVIKLSSVGYFCLIAAAAFAVLGVFSKDASHGGMVGILLVVGAGFLNIDSRLTAIENRIFGDRNHRAV